MRRVTYIIIASVFSICSLLASNAIAQQIDTAHGSKVRPITDTMRPGIDTARTPDDSSFHMTKSPLEAVLLSTIIPGAGQVYLGQAWKLPILYGIGGAFLYGAIIQNFRYHYTVDSINNELARYAKDTTDIRDLNMANQLGTNREFYINDRDKWWIYLGLTYIANILDAYISANLYDFDVSDPTPSSFQSFFDPVDRSVGMSFSIKF